MHPPMIVQSTLGLLLYAGNWVKYISLISLGSRFCKACNDYCYYWRYRYRRHVVLNSVRSSPPLGYKIEEFQ